MPQAFQLPIFNLSQVRARACAALRKPYGAPGQLIGALPEGGVEAFGRCTYKCRPAKNTHGARARVLKQHTLTQCCSSFNLTVQTRWHPTGTRSQGGVEAFGRCTYVCRPANTSPCTHTRVTNRSSIAGCSTKHLGSAHKTPGYFRCKPLSIEHCRRVGLERSKHLGTESELCRRLGLKLSDDALNAIMLLGDASGDGLPPTITSSL